MKHLVLTPACLIVALTLLQPQAGAQTTTPATNGTAAADVPFSGSAQAWSNPSQALVLDGSYASILSLANLSLFSTVNVVTDNLQVTNFGFSIPSTATIQGVTATVNRLASGLNVTVGGLVNLTATVTDNSVRLAGTGVTSSNLASGAAWPGSAANATYGGTSNLWGATLTPAIVNDPSFGMALAANLNGSQATVVIVLPVSASLIPGASVDEMTLAVTYSMPIVLPIHLTEWSVTRQGSANFLKWSASTIDLPGRFIIERSANGKDWSDLATVSAPKGIGDYSYADNAPFQNGPSYYRLRLHTAGEADSYSTVQVISTQSAHPVVSLYPNPFTDIINVASPGSFNKVSVKNIQGATIYEKTFGTGTKNAQVPASGLPRGTYFVQVDGATYKLIKN